MSRRQRALSTIFVLLAVASTSRAGNITSIGNLAQCASDHITWNPGQDKPPYILIINVIPDTSTPNPPQKTFRRFPDLKGTSITWTVDMAAGTHVQVVLENQGGTMDEIDNLVIKNSSNNSCLPGAVVSTHKALRPEAIGGIIAGGLLFLGLLAGFLIWVRRRGLLWKKDQRYSSKNFLSLLSCLPL